MVPDRIEIIQRCLIEEVLPRLIGEDMPRPRSERQRACLRVVTNYVAALIEGNVRHLANDESPVSTLSKRGRKPKSKTPDLDALDAVHGARQATPKECL